MIVIGPAAAILLLIVLGWLFRDSGCLEFLGCYALALLVVGAAVLGEYLGWWGPLF
ncbi:hypothetical protein [Streptomonospora alba]|uniref:hypothetical protein n=1 Tax=Streptomonospora alba TaxID=183763 RepID=UPI0012EE7B11|nr:hypothetical protein [Streptomonospora alba]